MKKNKNLYIGLLIAVLGLILLLSFVYEDKIQSTKINERIYSLALFDSNSSNAEERKIFRYTEEHAAEFSEVRISFDFKANVFDAKYGNVFQTAPDNSGIRVEAAPPSLLAIVIGYENEDKLKGFMISETLETNRWYNVRIDISRTKDMQVYLDNKLVVDVHDQNLNFAISDIAIGAGFNANRNWNGGIRNFSMSYTLYAHNLDSEKGLHFFRLLAFIVLLGLFFVLFKSVSLDREQKINLSALIVLLGFSVSTGYHYATGVYFHAGFPFNSFLFRPEARFSDFTDLYRRVLDAEGLWGFPLNKFIVSFFTIFPVNWALALFLSFFIVLFVYCCSKNIMMTSNLLSSCQNVFIFTCLSYPCLFAIERANIESILFALIYFFIFLYHTHPRLSIVFLSVAVAMKAFPAVFGVIFFSDRKWKLFGSWIFISLGILLFCLWMEGIGGEGFFRSAHHLVEYNKTYVYGNEGFYYGNSIFGAIKYLYATYWGLFDDFIPRLIQPYLFGTLLYFFVIAYYIIKFETVYWKKVALLVFCADLLPYVSADYKLLHIFIPFFLFVNYEVPDRYDCIYSILFSSLFIPKAYHHLSAYPEASISVLLNPAIMLAFSFLIIIQGMQEKKLNLSVDGSA